MGAGGGDIVEGNVAVELVLVVIVDDVDVDGSPVLMLVLKVVVVEDIGMGWGS